MEKLLQSILNWINSAEDHVLIGISGHGAAGKTTFAQMLLNNLKENEVNYINTDPYIVSSDIRKHTFIHYTYEDENHRFKMTACHPAAHHLPSLERDIQLVRTGLDFYTIDTHYSNSTLISSKNKVTIVEGMSVSFINPDYFDLNIYFYTDAETEFKRRSNRDISERGVDIQYLIQSHEERRIQYELFMHPSSEQFDVIVKTSDQSIYIEKNSLLKGL